MASDGLIRSLEAALGPHNARELLELISSTPDQTPVERIDRAARSSVAELKSAVEQRLADLEAKSAVPHSPPPPPAKKE